LPRSESTATVNGAQQTVTQNKRREFSGELSDYFFVTSHKIWLLTRKALQTVAIDADKRTNPRCRPGKRLSVPRKE
jgi:hypothetical protein